MSTATVSAWHLELVDGSTNKFYRLYLQDRRLVRNWGRRGARGQWKTELHSDERDARYAAMDVRNAKSYKGYEEIFSVDFELESASEFDALTSGFERAWLEAVPAVELAGDSDGVFLVNEWDRTAACRPDALLLHDSLSSLVLWRGSKDDGRVVVRAPGKARSALENAFDEVSAGVWRSGLDQETISVALRLYSPSSNGPYQSFSTALEDALKMFGKKK